MAGVHTLRGIHTEWDDATGPNDTKDLAIGWAELGDPNALPSARDAFKAAFTKIYRQPSRGLRRCKPPRRRPNPLDIFPKPRLNERIGRRGPLFVVQRSC